MESSDLARVHDSLTRCLDFANDVLSREGLGRYGPAVRAECRRFKTDLGRDDLRFNSGEADRVMAYFERALRFYEGQFIDKPFLLEPSQAFIIGNIYGWEMLAPNEVSGGHDWVRRFRRAYIEQAKGSGKTPLAAGMGIWAITGDREPAAECYVGASTRAQAEVCFSLMVNFAKESPPLKKRLRVMGGATASRIVNEASKSVAMAVSSHLRKTGSGLKPSCIILDELHEHRDSELLDMLEMGFKWRQRPLTVMLTNSGFDRNSVCYIQHSYAQDVAHGRIKDDRQFQYLCDLDDDDDPMRDESCWIKTNPTLGVAQVASTIRENVERARAIPANESKVRRLHFCEWVDSETTWINPEVWGRCLDKEITWAELKDRECYGGIDLSHRVDMSCIALAFPDGYDDAGQPRMIVWVKSYMPAEGIAERERVDRVPYTQWAADGYISTPPGLKISYQHMAADLMEIDDHCRLRSACYDKWSIRAFQEQLDDMGGSGIHLLEHPQGFAHRKKDDRHDMSPDLYMPRSIEELESMIVERRVRFAWNPVLTHAASGAAFRENATAQRAFEKRRATNRIDALVATAMAIGLAVSDKSTNPWENPDFTLITS